MKKSPSYGTQNFYSYEKNVNFFTIFKINVVPRGVQYHKKYKPQVPKPFCKKKVKNIPRRNCSYTTWLFSQISELCRTKNCPPPGLHKGTRTTLSVLTVGTYGMNSDVFKMAGYESAWTQHFLYVRYLYDTYRKITLMQLWRWKIRHPEVWDRYQ